MTFLSEKKRPLFGFSLIDATKAKRYADHGETFGAATKIAFQTIDMATKGLALNQLEEEEYKQSQEAQDDFSEYIEEYEPITNDFSQGGGILGTGINHQRKKDKKEFLPKFNKEELVQQGINIPENIEVPSEGLTKAEAHLRLAFDRERMENEAIIASKKPGIIGNVSAFSGGLVGSLADPLMLVPFVNGATRARLLVKSGKATRAGIVSKTAMMGAAEGAGITLLSDAMYFPKANKWGFDYTFKDVLIDATMGGALGSFLGTAGGIIGTRKMGINHQKAMTKALVDIEQGKPVDILSIVLDERLQQAVVDNEIDLKALQQVTLKNKNLDEMNEIELFLFKEIEEKTFAWKKEAEKQYTIEKNNANLDESITKKEFIEQYVQNKENNFFNKDAFFSSVDGALKIRDEINVARLKEKTKIWTQEAESILSEKKKHVSVKEKDTFIKEYVAKAKEKLDGLGEFQLDEQIYNRYLTEAEKTGAFDIKRIEDEMESIVIKDNDTSQKANDYMMQEELESLYVEDKLSKENKAIYDEIVAEEARLDRIEKAYNLGSECVVSRGLS